MPRERTEQYEQDRLGNVRRKLDPYRARDGYEGGDENGIVSYGAGDTGSDVVVYTPPADVDQYFLEVVRVQNATAGAGVFTINEAELDDAGAVTSTTQRSLPEDVGADATVEVEPRGKPFTGSVAINCSVACEVAVGVIADHHEASEPASEQTS